MQYAHKSALNIVFIIHNCIAGRILPYVRPVGVPTQAELNKSILGDFELTLPAFHKLNDATRCF